MGKDIKKRFTVSLDIDTKDVEKQVKATVGNLKTILADLGKASDKMGYFKELVDYIGQIDTALTTLKTKNKDAFNHMFDGLDENLHNQLEGLFGTSGTALSQLDVLREKLEALTPKSGIKELRNFAKEINTLFDNIGTDSPFEDIDKQFAGKANASHIQLLTDALDNFATVWDGVNQKISSGFGTGGAGSGNSSVTVGTSKEMQEEIDKLKKQKQEIQELLDIIDNPDNTDAKLSTKNNEQLKQLKDIKDAYLAAKEAKEQLEKSNMTNTQEYSKVVAQYVKVAAMVKSAFQSEDLTDKSIDFVSTKDNLDILDESESFIKSFQTKMQSQSEQIRQLYSDLIVDIDAKLQKIQTPDQTSASNEYDDLKKKVQEYYELRLKLKNVEADSSEYNRISDRQRAIQDEIYSIKELSEEQEDAYYDLFDSIDSEDNLQLNEAVTQFCNILKIDIPNSAEQASSAAASAFAKITKDAEQASEAAQNVMYHLGNLLNGKGTPHDTFGDMAENLTTKALGTRYEQYGFGVLGGGLFGVVDPSTIDHEPGRSSFIQSIDISKYNMYMADTEERATALMDFLSKLQKFSMKSAEPNYTGFDSYLQNTDVDSLYDQFKVVFEQSDLTKEKFQTFIDEMVSLLKQAGLAFDTDTGVLDFTNMSEEIANSENISTRFMKMLGFEGINTGTTSFGGLGQGSVLFDFEKVDIVGYFDSVKAAVQDYEKIVQQANDGTAWTGTTEQLQQYASNIDSIIDKIAQYKNSGVLKDTSELDETLSKLSQIKENINDILSGKDVSGNSPFETITTGSGSIDNVDDSINKAKVKLESFLELSKEIQSQSLYGDADNNVEIGKYTERLEVAKKELDTLGEQGLVTAEQLEQVQVAFDKSMEHLKGETSHYDSFYEGGGGYTEDYWYEYQDAEAKNKQLQEQLSTQVNTQLQGTTALLEKQKLTYEDILSLVKTYNDEATMKTLADAGNWDVYDKMVDIRTDIAKKLVPTEMLGIGSDAPDKWLSMVGMSAEEAAQKLYELYERYYAVDDLIDTTDLEVTNESEYKAETQAIEQNSEALERNNKLKVQENDVDDSNKTSVDKIVDSNTSAEMTQLEALQQKLIAVKTAVDEKTQAFEDEYVTVDAAVEAEIASLERLKTLLEEIQGILQVVLSADGINFGNIDILNDKTDTNTVSSVIQGIQSTLESIYGVLQGFTGIESDGKNSIKQKEPATNNGITSSKETKNLASKLSDFATESTLTAIKGAVEQIAKIKQDSDANQNEDIKQTIGTMVNALTSNIQALKDVMDGIVQHQKAQRTDTSKAMSRIADPKQHQYISDLARGSVSNLGSEVEIKSLQALADGIVKVEGAFKNVNDEWEGFTVKINEHNSAVDLAINKQSAFAKALNNSKNVIDTDDGAHIYNKEEVEARAQKHLEEYAAQGKNATVQFKDDGKYTITILEEIDGLSKRIFQTFDENDDKIERTTVTMSNNQKTKLDNLQKKLIETGLSDGLISDTDGVYKDYQDAADALSNMINTYSQLDNISDVEIANWKQQIALVQQLGGQVEDLIKQRKLANDQKIFESDRGKKLNKFDLDKATLQKNIAIPDSFNQRMDDARTAIANAADNDSLKIAINNWEALQNEIKKTATEQDLYIKKSKETKNTNTKPDQFTKNLTKQQTTFAQYKKDVQDSAGVTDELKTQLEQLETELSAISDADGLSNWVQSFKNLKTEIANAQKGFKNSQTEILTEIAGKANSKFKELDFKANDNNLSQEQQDIVDKRKELLQQISEYNTKVRSGQEAEIDGIQATRDELYKLIDAYKQAHNIENASGNSNKAAYGTKQLNTFTGKYNSLINRASSAGLNTDVDAVKKLTTAYENLKNIQSTFKVGENVDSGDGKKKADEFQRARDACIQYYDELIKVVQAEEEWNNNGIKEDAVAENFIDNDNGRMKALTDYVHAQYGARVEIEKFTDACNTAWFTVDNGNGTVTKMSASFNGAKTSIKSFAGDVEKTQTKVQKLWSVLQGKVSELWIYTISRIGVDDLIQQVKQGVNYVKEIDSALTELKKVTDETDATYNQFLQTMSKTADTVGSTVKDLTSSAADWARLNI